MSFDPRLVILHVTEQSPRGGRTMYIYPRLLKDRIIFPGTTVDVQVANVVMAQLLHLDSEQDINSPGGSIPAMLAMYDTVRFVNADVASDGPGDGGVCRGVQGRRARGRRCPTRGYSCSRPESRGDGKRSCFGPGGGPVCRERRWGTV